MANIFSMLLNANLSKATAFINKHLSFFRFLLIGSVNTSIDVSLFAIFANVLDFNPVIASILSTAITISISFPLNRSFVFKSSRKKRHTAGHFLAITLFNAWVVQSAIIFIVVNSFDSTSIFADHTDALNLIAKISSISVSMFLNYFGYRYIFDQKRDK